MKDLINCRKPRVGDPINYKGVFVGHVSSVENNICNTNVEHGGFIWRFKDGLNKLHSWPGKDEGLNA